MVEGSPRSSKRESGAHDYGWRVKVHMPILRTEAVRGERVNAELSRANQVPWDKRLSVVLLAHTLGVQSSAMPYTTPIPHALVNTTKGPRELLNIDEER